MQPSATSIHSKRLAAACRQASGLAIVLSLLCFTSAAQQGQGGSPLPDAPSASAQPQAKADTSKASDKSQPGVLSGSSLFFPNIATKSGPLTPGQKFELFALNSISLSAWIGSAAGAGINQALDSPDGYGQGAEGYGKRFGAAMARNASSQFFGTFLLASALHQDPRFFVRDNLNFGESIKYSIKRVFITQSDSGNQVVNWSGLMGPLMAEGLANVYYPDNYRTVGNTFSRYGYDLGLMAGTNLLRQYWPKINRRLKILPQSQPASSKP